MKTCKKLLSFVAAALLAAGTTGCQDYEIPAADISLSYPVGEMVLGGGTYTSGRPTVRGGSELQFSTASATHNGEAADASIAAINPLTGVVTLTPAGDPSAVGRYLISVRLTDGETTTDWPDALSVIVKGILFAEPHVAATRGEALSVPVEKYYLAQTEGCTYTLEVPENAAGYSCISVDKNDCTVTVSADAEAGIYPVSIRVKNRTNPDGFVFEEVLTVTVESRPYDLHYTPSEVTLIPLEGHLSPRPTLRAATLAEGEAVSYSLLDDFGIFSIDAETGIISLPEDLKLVAQTAKTYRLQVRATNGKGSTSFPDAYSVTVDPEKKADPVTGATYPDRFPVELRPGQAWTSERPTVIGSTVGIQWSLPESTPEGISIDPKTGIITFAPGHRMPLRTADNKLTVLVSNQGMSTPYALEIGDFSIDPVMWSVSFTPNGKENSLVNSGIGNMDRYSFSGRMLTNYNSTDQTTATSGQTKQGWARSSSQSVNKLVCVDFMGVNASTATSAGVSNMNNDWLVSEEIELPESGFNPSIRFNLVHNYGANENNLLELYIVEINDRNVYVKGEQAQDDKGLDAKPSDLPWVGLASTAEGTFPGTITTKAGAVGTTPTVPNAFDISDWKGKKIRFALRYWNPSEHANNTRNYRVESLRVEDSLGE